MVGERRETARAPKRKLVHAQHDFIESDGIGHRLSKLEHRTVAVAHKGYSPLQLRIESDQSCSAKRVQDAVTGPREPLEDGLHYFNRKHPHESKSAHQRMGAPRLARQLARRTAEKIRYGAR